jgi:hypothetical protein
MLHPVGESIADETDVIAGIDREFGGGLRLVGRANWCVTTEDQSDHGQDDEDG